LKGENTVVDDELDFRTEQHHEPVRIRNAVLIDGHVADKELYHDAETAYAHSVRIRNGLNYRLRDGLKFRQEFGLDGSDRATKYAKAVCEGLHHQKEYAPCKCLSRDELEQLGYQVCDCEA
jgi:hypothetical protein